MRLVILASLLLGLLSGCASLSGPSPEELRANDQATCAAYGFKPGTDTYAYCMMQLDQVHRQESKEARARFAAAMREMGRQLNPPTVTCTSNAYGNAYRFGSNTRFNANQTTTCR